MTLSFREQAAIALKARVFPDASTTAIPDCVAMAEALADACCAKWGHTLGNIDGLSDDQIVAKPCERCGKDIAT